MSDIVERLNATCLDKDNFPRMSTERAAPVSLVNEAVTEITRLRAQNAELVKALRAIADGTDMGKLTSMQGTGHLISNIHVVALAAITKVESGT